MKQAGLYHSLINPVDKPTFKLETPEEDAARFQARQRWLESTITRDHIASLEKKFNLQISTALSLAKNSPVNHEAILKALVTANAYADTLGMYNQEQNK